MTTQSDLLNFVAEHGPQHERSGAYRAALAFHCLAHELTPERGGQVYQGQLARTSFRIMMTLDEAAACTSVERSRRLLPILRACCFKMIGALKSLCVRGFITQQRYVEVLAQLLQLQEFLVTDVPAVGAPGVSNENAATAASSRAKDPAAGEARALAHGHDRAGSVTDLASRAAVALRNTGSRADGPIGRSVTAAARSSHRTRNGTT